ncbi:serine hydrolase domain-containing protein [Salmonirosea aquatica]|uniref:Serine hydrolase n=1 Tax=Salmonirosea aquatica TaxID=2654236 RepID=A0A7C9BIF6_9BACT|nr:serine hydrolase [Cytophagaceae bacterium SJW1-29]
MKTTYFRFALATLCLALTACESTDIPQPTLDAAPDFSEHAQHATYQKAVEDYAGTNRIPGAVLAIKKENAPLWIGATGYSNLEHHTTMQVNTPFRAGSIAKTFVATAVMLLKDEGKFGLDDKLADLLPASKGQIPQAEQITLRQLLAHTSGIFDPTNDDTQYQLDLVNNPARRGAMTPDEVLRRYVYGRSLLFEPGERFSYSNSNYMLIGRIIEQQTGKSLQTVLDEQIIQPLGLTGTYLEKRDDRNVARGYADFYANDKLMDVTALDRAEADGGAYGGLISTAADLFRFSEALFGEKLVGPAALQEMLTPYPVRQGTTTYGLGVDQWESEILGTGYGNNGTLAGTEANVFYFPQKKATFVLMANFGSGTRKGFLDSLLD